MQLSKTQRRLRLALVILAASAGFAAAEASALAPLSPGKIGAQPSWPRAALAALTGSR